jgi:Zn-dependent protease with chaperone function
VINLVWDNPSSRWSPMSLLNNFVIESVLYHEIGHHVRRHTLGQDPKQEKEADKYSARIMANSHHLLFRIARLFAAARRGLIRALGGAKPAA